MQTEQKRPSWWQPGMRLRNNGSVEWRFYVSTPEGAKQKSAYGTTIAELKVDRARIERLHEAAPEKISLDELLNRYLVYRDEEGYDKGTTANIGGMFNNHVRPKLGKFMLADLCTSWVIIGDHFRALGRARPNSRVLQTAFDELRRAFDYAIAKQWVTTTNPCEKVERPQYASPEREPFTVDQVFKMLELARDTVTRLLVFFLVTTASRPGEAIPIRVRDLDLLHKTVEIRQFLGRDAKGKVFEKDEGKTRRAIRTTPLIDPLVDALNDYLAIAGLGPDDYVFPSPEGRRLSANNWRERIWQPLTIAIGRPDAHPYDLRHTANQFLAEFGVDAETRAAICGHTKEVNEEVYTHGRQVAVKREALTKVGELFALRLKNKGTDEGTESAAASA